MQLFNKRYPEKLKQKWLKKRLECPIAENDEDGISVMNIGGVFMVVIIGIIIAFFALICEYLYIKCYKLKCVRVSENSRNAMNAVNTMLKIARDNRTNIKRHPKPNSHNIQISH